MQLQQTLEALVQPIVAAIAYEFVGLELAGLEDEVTDDASEELDLGMVNKADHSVRHAQQTEQSSVLRVYIDRDSGVDVNDCVKVSRLIDEALEANAGLNNFILEVSSPGIDRRLFTLEQCHKQVNQVIKVMLKQPINAKQTSVNGKLIEVKDQQLILEVDKVDGKEKLRFDFKDVKQARVVPQWLKVDL